MHGWYIIRNDLCALHYSPADGDFPNPSISWVGTLHRSQATSFPSESEAIRILRNHVNQQANVVAIIFFP